MNKDPSSKTYRSIGEVAKELDLKDKKSGKIQTHTIRYWETQFKQIKPTIRAGGRRYYSQKDFNKIKLIKFLLKERGLKISGVKKILNDNKMQSIDDTANYSVYKPTNNETRAIKEKIKNIAKIVKEIKKIKNG